MFGREPVMPVDVVFGFSSSNSEDKCTTKYISELKQRLQDAYRHAQTAIKSSQQKQKCRYDMKARTITLKEGDRVLVKKVVYDGKHKISDKWEDDIYVILAKANDKIPVYKVRREDGEGRTRVLQRKLLLPIGTKLPRSTPPVIPRKRGKAAPVSIITENDSDSDSEFSYVDYSAFRNENSQVAPSLDDDDQSTTEEASAAGSGEDASHQDRVLENQPEEVINDDEPEDDVNNNDDDENIINDDVNSTDNDINESDDSEDEMPSMENDQTPIPAPRRSTRQRKMPTWTKEFVMMNQKQPDWLRRAVFVKGLINDGSLRDIDQSRCQMALLNIVSASTCSN